MKESCHAQKWVISHTWTTLVTHMNESCHAHEWVMSRTEMSHITHMNDSCHTHEWVLSRTWRSHVTRMTQSYLTYGWVTSHTWISRVTHLNESCQIHDREGTTITAAIKCTCAYDSAYTAISPYAHATLRSYNYANTTPRSYTHTTQQSYDRVNAALRSYTPQWHVIVHIPFYNHMHTPLWSKETPPPGGVYLLSGFHIKNREEEEPPWRTAPKIDGFWGWFFRWGPFLPVLDLENTQQGNPPGGGGFFISTLRSYDHVSAHEWWNRTPNATNRSFGPWSVWLEE